MDASPERRKEGWSFWKDTVASIIGALIAIAPFVIQFAMWMSDVNKEQAVQRSDIEHIKQLDAVREAQRVERSAMLQKQLDKMDTNIMNIDNNIRNLVERRER